MFFCQSAGRGCAIQVPPFWNGGQVRFWRKADMANDRFWPKADMPAPPSCDSGIAQEPKTVTGIVERNRADSQ